MYQEFIETILIYIQALNSADAAIAAKGWDGSMYPQLDEIPVSMDGVRVGRLVDEIGGAWSYVAEPQS